MSMTESEIEYLLSLFHDGAPVSYISKKIQNKEWDCCWIVYVEYPA